MKRRAFLKSATISVGAISVTCLNTKADTVPFKFSNENSPLVISSGNGIRAVELAMEKINEGSDALDAVIEGVNLVEDDPEETSVGIGGMPNEEGEVELDSCCMHGPTHNAGGVAGLKNIKNPSKVAKMVMERTDHVLLAGEGALKFALAHGFKEENLLTEKARKIWLYWMESTNTNDFRIPPPNKDIPDDIREYFKITGTITCLGIDKKNNISGVTTTSGMAFKIPGRIGDSPIIGAGLYVDNEVGACGSTGRGEENLKNLSCFLVVELMRQGKEPEEACLEAAKRIVDKIRIPNLLNANNKPNFNVTFYALRKDGKYGSGSIYGPVDFTFYDSGGSGKKGAAFLYDWKYF